MRHRQLAVILFALLVSLSSLPALAGKPPKVEVCHVPPGNPGNFHTITVNVNAVDAHLGHGDLLGACADSCETLCDDGDPCTVDACDPGTEQCAASHPPVNCDDGSLCTVDSCDSATGACVNEVNVVCEDGNLCTIDFCDPLTGTCGNTPAVCEAGETCDLSTGECSGEDACVGNFCQNGSACIPNDDGSSYSCDCLPGFTGMYCEIDPCGYEHCQNGGTCIRADSGHSYTCECAPGYGGSNCQTEL